MRVAEKEFPRILIKSVPCLWHEAARASHREAFEKAHKEWKQLEKKWNSEITRVPYFEYVVYIGVHQVKWGHYQVGDICRRSLKEVKAKGKPEVGSPFEDACIVGEILEIQKEETGTQKKYPDWALPDEPVWVRPYLSNHEAVCEMQQMIEEVCPSVAYACADLWDQDEYPTRMLHEDVTTGKGIPKMVGAGMLRRKAINYPETGWGYEVLVEGDRLNLYKFQIDRIVQRSLFSSGSVTTGGSTSMDDTMWRK